MREIFWVMSSLFSASRWWLSLCCHCIKTWLSITSTSPDSYWSLRAAFRLQTILANNYWKAWKVNPRIWNTFFSKTCEMCIRWEWLAIGVLFSTRWNLWGMITDSGESVKACFSQKRELTQNDIFNSWQTVSHSRCETSQRHSGNVFCQPSSWLTLGRNLLLRYVKFHLEEKWTVNWFVMK